MSDFRSSHTGQGRTFFSHRSGLRAMRSGMRVAALPLRPSARSIVLGVVGDIGGRVGVRAAYRAETCRDERCGGSKGPLCSSTERG